MVSETVEAARLLRRPKLSGLVNAILRRFLRERETDLPTLGMEVEYDHPQWLIEMLQQDWPDDWRSILAANNERAAMWLRVNPAHASNAEYRDELQAQAINAELLAGAAAG